MTDSPNRLTVDGLTFEVRRSARRATVGVTVDRGGELILHAPEDCPMERIEAFARQKQLWIYTKLAQKDRLTAPRRPKEYVPGEGFAYLGRHYRLRLVGDDAAAPLRLYRGWFELRRRDTSDGRKHFTRWYRQHALPWIERRVESLTPRVGQQPASVNVLSLGNRWGSCSPDGRLSFHWRTILLPPPFAEYVIAHELVHLREHQHTSDFWQLLERIMPDHRDRSRWLAERGAHYDL
jgi:predicted metal-dependent hydrolase